MFNLHLIFKTFLCITPIVWGLDVCDNVQDLWDFYNNNIAGNDEYDKHDFDSEISDICKCAEESVPTVVYLPDLIEKRSDVPFSYVDREYVVVLRCKGKKNKL